MLGGRTLLFSSTFRVVAIRRTRFGNEGRGITLLRCPPFRSQAFVAAARFELLWPVCCVQTHLFPSGPEHQAFSAVAFNIEAVGLVELDSLGCMDPRDSACTRQLL